MLVVGNKDRCGRCGSRHGGNNRLCPVHGAVSVGCCEPMCKKEDYIVLRDVFANGNTKSIEKVLAASADLTGYEPDGEGFGLPMYTKGNIPMRIRG